MNQELWNQFILENSSPSSFPQSWQWGEFQSALGNRVYQLRVGELQALVIVRKLHLGRTYLEIPKGPIIQESGIRNKESWGGFIKQLAEIAKKEKAVLTRINPPYNNNFQFSFSNLQKPEILLRQTEPEDTILVDLSSTEDELAQNMHEKSRYNIRLAERKGVKVRVATGDKVAFEKFLDLLAETSKRDGITSWPSSRFWKFWEKFLTPSLNVREGGGELFPHAELLIGEYQGKILAAAIVMLFGDSATYLYAASSGEDRSANAPSLVLWEAIKLAKARGKRWYDMWGIAPKGAGETHPWSGITRFKTRYVKVGVTGKEIRNIGARDLIFDKKFHTLFKIAKKFHP
ncbi:MAG: peptidoglycan bridge formation glycyltransferase FemA/FemB family protein [bacterium]|nr:peptidoglycan bridge formation glycyltransferase FemA/FemB family protein [bacterium]